MTDTVTTTVTTTWTCVGCGTRELSTAAIGLGWGLVVGIREGQYNPYCGPCLESWKRAHLPATAPTEGRNPGRLARP